MCVKAHIDDAIESLEDARSEASDELGTAMMLADEIESLRELRQRYEEINNGTD